MNAYDFVHLALHALGGEIRGKTKFQKTIYFLGILTGQLEDLGYRPHFYGPYSDDVAAALERLRALGFADQTIASGGAVDSRGFEVARFDYRLNEAGQQMAQRKAAGSGCWADIKSAAATLKKLGDADYVKLSIAAKTYFMLGEKKGKARLDELANIARDFGWSITVDQVLQAAQYLGSLGLVQLS